MIAELSVGIPWVIEFIDYYLYRSICNGAVVDTNWYLSNPPKVFKLFSFLLSTTIHSLVYYGLLLLKSNLFLFTEYLYIVFDHTTNVSTVSCHCNNISMLVYCNSCLWKKKYLPFCFQSNTTINVDQTNCMAWKHFISDPQGDVPSFTFFGTERVNNPMRGGERKHPKYGGLLDFNVKH